MTELAIDMSQFASSPKEAVSAAKPAPERDQKTPAENFARALTTEAPREDPQVVKAKNLVMMQYAQERAADAPMTVEIGSLMKKTVRYDEAFSYYYNKAKGGEVEELKVMKSMLKIERAVIRLVKVFVSPKPNASSEKQFMYESLVSAEAAVTLHIDVIDAALLAFKGSNAGLLALMAREQLLSARKEKLNRRHIRELEESLTGMGLSEVLADTSFLLQPETRKAIPDTSQGRWARVMLSRRNRLMAVTDAFSVEKKEKHMLTKGTPLRQ